MRRRGACRTWFHPAAPTRTPSSPATRSSTARSATPVSECCLDARGWDGEGRGGAGRGGRGGETAAGSVSKQHGSCSAAIRPHATLVLPPLLRFSGFDPLSFSKGDMKSLKLKEIKNARLAMVAFLGVWGGVDPEGLERAPHAPLAPAHLTRAAAGCRRSLPQALWRRAWPRAAAPWTTCRPTWPTRGRTTSSTTASACPS